MKVALVHDDLVQWGGAERVLGALAEYFPDAPIYTSVYDRNNPFFKQYFSNREIKTSFLQKIPGWKLIYKLLLPLYPIAFEQFDFTGFDLVISQSTRFAKVVVTKPETTHVCYCHTPPRFLWSYSAIKVSPLIKPYLKLLKFYDMIASQRVDIWWAGSKNAQQRIKQVYNKDSEVLYPFVDTERFKGISSFDGGYLLVISRLVEYKRIDLVVKAAKRLKLPLKIVGTGPMIDKLQRLAGDNVEFLSNLSEHELALVISGAKALVVAGEEDFGLTPLEAQALGKPVIAFGQGGATETVIPGKTGYLFESQSVDSLIEAILLLDKSGYNGKSCLEQSEKFSQAQFKNRLDQLCTNILKD